MGEITSFFAGIAAAGAWLVIWGWFLHAARIVPLRWKLDDSARHERLIRLGMLKYVLTVGVLGSGLAFGLAMVIADIGSERWHGWTTASTKLLFSAVFFGLFHGFWSWHNISRKPIPFPPNYPPQG